MDTTNITRFNPTSNGHLHLGHLYVALVNECQARRTRHGKFIIRIEDNQTHFIDCYGEKVIKEYAQSMIDDIEWLDIHFDHLYLQSSKEQELEDFKRKIPLIFPFAQQRRRSDQFPLGPTDDEFLYYSYTPRYTFEKVVLDYLDSVTFLTRGIDLITEFSLYNYYCDVMRLPPPVHIYLPRLAVKDGQDISYLSKSGVTLTIRSLREQGHTPHGIIDLVKRACLSYPDHGWNLANLKQKPVLDLEWLE